MAGELKTVKDAFVVVIKILTVIGVLIGIITGGPVGLLITDESGGSKVGVGLLPDGTPMFKPE